ncbi:MAG: bifunctional diaminohydroxyphosphoribosylaminopyrimidine deaminase/5-amino-6-(5-phosphoribosylamino)uracil reductase RibD [Armatimonadetes bacterium]|nr:bifunctional diaminohydroxyphosphoribosylaminopyrimidine deaminase/5-amino-6-(5-phosphoribosylamino)uracil reductase RibD [Armatimonadota bacterium]
MRRALALARKGLGRTSPNPLVGAIVVRGDTVIGEGWHAGVGQPHAEPIALAAAAAEAAGATLYVTLEPCDHHGRTPPCTEVIIRAGIVRVVSAMEDPDPRVRGAGHARLRRAGITVETGLLASCASSLNAAYVKHRRTGRPLVALKWAMTLDGRIATRTGSSRWITSEAAREEAHRLRDRYDAILIGRETCVRDDPALTCRISGGRDPVRVVLDSRGRLPETARIFREGTSPVVVAVTEAASGEDQGRLERAGAKLVVCRSDAHGQVDIADLLDRLGERGVLSVLSEGGAKVHASFLEGGHADRVHAFVAPIVIGGDAAPGPVSGRGVASLSAALRLENPVHCVFGSDIVVAGDLHGRLEAS